MVWKTTFLHNNRERAGIVKGLIYVKNVKTSYKLQ